MICPTDLVQMHQKDQMGHGYTSDMLYRTAECKECPICGRLVIEEYSVVEVENKEAAQELLDRLDRI